MIKILPIAFFLFLNASSIFAQGYRGKRFMAAYSPSYSMVNPPFGFTQFILYNSVKVGYTLSDHWVVNLNGQYGRAKDRDVRGYEVFDLKDVTGGISFIYFRKFHQNYAPIGRYMGIRFDYGKQNSTRTVNVLSVPSDPTSYEIEKIFYDDQSTISMMVISAEFGRNYLFKEKFLFGYGIQCGFVLGDKHDEAPKYRQLLKPHFNFGIVF